MPLFILSSRGGDVRSFSSLVFSKVLCCSCNLTVSRWGQ